MLRQARVANGRRISPGQRLEIPVKSRGFKGGRTVDLGQAAWRIQAPLAHDWAVGSGFDVEAGARPGGVGACHKERLG